jgi:hypothetical protein
MQCVKRSAICSSNRMSLAAAIILVAGMCPALPTPIQYSTVQYSMGGLGLRKPQAPAALDAALTPDESKRLVQAINRLPKKERKRVTNAMQKLNPQERQQFILSVKRQLAAKGTGSQAAKRAPR